MESCVPALESNKRLLCHHHTEGFLGCMQLMCFVLAQLRHWTLILSNLEELQGAQPHCALI